MQIFQKLFKTTNDTTSKKEPANNQKGKSKDIVLFGICRGTSKSDKSRSRSRKTVDLFNIVSRKDIAKEYFYSTINLRNLESDRSRQHFVMKMKKESFTRGLNIPQKANSEMAIVTASHIGHKQVLPISDSAARSSSGEKKEKAKGDKAKTMSKMKELLRWAAAAKSDKGNKQPGRKVFHFRYWAALKAAQGDDNEQISNIDSPKISFGWDVETSSTTTSSAFSMPALTKNGKSININFASLNSTPMHIHHCPAAARKGSWITTDSDFVVLEL